MLKKLTPEQMAGISDRPAFLPKFHFCKHYGAAIGHVPADYLDWILRQRKDDGSFEFDKNVIQTAMTELESRHSARSFG
jgi:hypothetical protein